MKLTKKDLELLDSALVTYYIQLDETIRDIHDLDERLGKERARLKK